MKILRGLSRRDACLLLPALAATAAFADQPAPLASHAYRFEDLPVRSNGANRFRAVLDGQTHAGARLEIHETTLAPGASPHPPHRHIHEEIFLMREGAVEVTISGKTTRLGPGGVAFIASNDLHGLRNAGETPANYFVLALGSER